MQKDGIFLSALRKQNNMYSLPSPARVTSRFALFSAEAPARAADFGMPLKLPNCTADSFCSHGQIHKIRFWRHFPAEPVHSPAPQKPISLIGLPTVCRPYIPLSVKFAHRDCEKCIILSPLSRTRKILHGTRYVFYTIAKKFQKTNCAYEKISMRLKIGENRQKSAVFRPKPLLQFF